MCATELFAIHASVLNRKTSLQCIHQETETEPKPRNFANNLLKTTVHKKLEIKTTMNLEVP